MSETKTLLHADPKTDTYSYKIEETAEHLTVVRLVRNADHHWHYHMTAERLVAAAGHPAGDTVQGDADGFATADEAIAAARDHARTLLAA
ncbi:MAG TPA: hypothetical protein VJO99_20490 [Burkholderiaceae bacterium]|nr:hypothetical protein [Burkholderiaceae bacterium]